MPRYSREPRPTVELFERHGCVLDVWQLWRQGAFTRPMHFALRQMTTFPDRVELARPPRTVAIVRTPLTRSLRPWFVCPRCRGRCGKLYLSTVDACCRRCAGLTFLSQRQWRATRLRDKAERIRARLWTDQHGKLIRPRGMLRSIYQRHLAALARIDTAIKTGKPLSPAYPRYWPRDEAGRFVAESECSDY